ncbi:type I secretion target repeat protein [Ruegeria lacuscaerulensis ITI-1157]|nr:type I secretion target repeat protein [Ruegeria lacuscaerulensis ITI-1157]SHI45434.1 Hint domain-containing protein [Ruegeria lacuscaerulensis ITI-1157]
MADYSIFVLGESQMTISGGQQLDGVTQGDGSHLVGQTITFNSRSATEVFITDVGADTDFSDNDGNQRLDGDQIIDGTLYSSGTQVEAEYGITLTDGTNTWQAIGFNLNNSSPSFGTIEGLAFIGGPGNFPPVGVPLTVVSAQEGPNFDSSDYVTPICYGPGTLIETERGPVAVEDLVVGDRVWTLDDGLQPVCWVGRQSVIAAGRFRMVTIPAGTLGNTAPLCVSQQHRLLIAHPSVELMFGLDQAFVPAISLVDAGGASLSAARTVTYHHFMLDRHAVVRANGALSESLLVSAAQSGTPDALFFPELDGAATMAIARPALTRREGAILMRGIMNVDREPGLIHTAHN